MCKKQPTLAVTLNTWTHGKYLYSLFSYQSKKAGATVSMVVFSCSMRPIKKLNGFQSCEALSYNPNGCIVFGRLKTVKRLKFYGIMDFEKFVTSFRPLDMLF